MRSRYYLSFIALSIPLSFQNCGRVDVTQAIEKISIKSEVIQPVEEVIEEIIEEDTQSVLSVASSLVVDLEPNTSKAVVIEPEMGSLPIALLSFKKNELLTAIQSKMRGDISLVDENSFLYKPAHGFQGFDYSEIFVSDEFGNTQTITLIFRVKSVSDGRLPMTNVLIYSENELDAMNRKLEGLPPPGPAEIFLNWSRFAKEEFYTKNDSIPDESEAKSWQFLERPDRISCSINSRFLTGFVSERTYEQFDFQSTLTSTDRDDDLIGLIIAFVRVDNNNHILEAIRTHGGVSPNQGWALRYTVNGRSPKIYGAKSVGGIHKNGAGDNGTGDRLGWNNRKSLVSIKRRGNEIQAWASDWTINESSLAINPESLIQINLDSETNPELKIFQGPQKYGYSSFSQRHTTFLNSSFTDGVNDKYVYDLKNNVVYELLPNGGYLRRFGTGVYDHLGTPRKVRNPDTGKTFLLNEDQSYEEIAD